MKSRYIQLRSPLAPHPPSNHSKAPSSIACTRSPTQSDHNLPTLGNGVPGDRSRCPTKVGHCSFHYPQITPLYTAQASRASSIQGICRTCMEHLSKRSHNVKWSPLLRDMHVRICYWRDSGLVCRRWSCATGIHSTPKVRSSSSDDPQHRYAFAALRRSVVSLSSTFRPRSLQRLKSLLSPDVREATASLACVPPGKYGDVVMLDAV
jgi:hypothetical protein